MEEMIKIKVYARTKYIRSEDRREIEVEKDVWDSMTDQEKDDYIFEVISQMDMIQWGFEEI